MNTYTDKLTTGLQQTPTSAAVQKKDTNSATAAFVDNRPGAIAQRQLQENINNSPRVQQLKAYQSMANNYTSSKALQLRQANAQENNAPVQKKANNTGLPDNLKSGVEHLSGIAMDDVKVHYNSPKPAQLQAHAYAQGTDIHIAPGQEKHLPHEAWHVVQQKQGRVRPTLQMKGIAVNDDTGLEREADVMGAKAIQYKSDAELTSLKQVNGTETTTQLGRKGELASGTHKRFIKLVLPGSGDLHWRTRTREEQETMVPIGSATGQEAWFRTVKGDNVEFTIAGPQGFGGASDTGANSIAQNIALGITLVLGQVKEEVRKDIRTRNIIILIKAHSRNAVAASQIAKELNVELYALYEGEWPEIELVMFDPVPGPLHSGELVESDVSLIPHTTLVYSMITQYAAGFAPQRILGAKRLIISRQDHGVGTNSSFLYGGKKYKGSNLNSLPKGVFEGVAIRQDAETNEDIETLLPIRNTEELEAVLGRASFLTTQRARLDTINVVARAFGLAAPPAKKKAD